jgi:hypothetical protein
MKLDFTFQKPGLFSAKLWIYLVLSSLLIFGIVLFTMIILIRIKSIVALVNYKKNLNKDSYLSYK